MKMRQAFGLILVSLSVPFSAGSVKKPWSRLDRGNIKEEDTVVNDHCMSDFADRGRSDAY